MVHKGLWTLGRWRHRRSLLQGMDGVSVCERELEFREKQLNISDEVIECRRSNNNINNKNKIQPIQQLIRASKLICCCVLLSLQTINSVRVRIKINILVAVEISRLLSHLFFFLVTHLSCKGVSHHSNYTSFRSKSSNQFRFLCYINILYITHNSWNLLVSREIYCQCLYYIF